MKRVVISSAFFLLLTVTIAVTILGERGFIQMSRLQIELQTMEQNNIKLRTENQRLKNEIIILKNDLRYLEELARKELGMAREDELIYRPETKK